MRCISSNASSSPRTRESPVACLLQARGGREGRERRLSNEVPTGQDRSQSHKATYCQFSIYPRERRVLTEMTSRTTSMEGSDASSREMAPFLRSLRRMLDTESTTIICWTVDGRAFEIHDVVALTKRILPKYFKHSKYASFQRQLNYFNFRKWTKSRTAVCTFSNPFFQRDSPQLGWRITRKRSLNSEAKSNGSPRSVTYESFSPQSLQMTSMHFAPPADPVNEVKKQTENTVLNWSSLDWVDSLFPSLEMLTRLDETPVELPPPAAYWSDRYPTSRTVPC